ncbi:hypothetical protein M2436_000421 [Streptomyces sp. HB372]|nr:hypothetical protein [Streptomyces sp. HB372]
MRDAEIYQVSAVGDCATEDCSWYAPVGEQWRGFGRAQPLGSDKPASARIEFHRKAGADGSRERCCGGGVVRPEFVSHAVGENDLDRTRATSAYSCLLNDFERNGGAHLVAVDDDG